MKNVIRKVPLMADKKSYHAVIETPRGSRSKFAYDPETGLFKLKNALPEGLVFPFNFGFFPGTLADDGDPLDVLVLDDQPLFPGCLVEAHLLGVIEAQQIEDGKVERNDRVVARVINKDLPSYFETFELNDKTYHELETFFTSYAKILGKKFKILGQKGADTARKIVKQAAREFSKKSKS